MTQKATSESEPHFSHISVIGLGLIGGSFAAALKRAGYGAMITGWDVNDDAVHFALENGYIDWTAVSLEEAVKDADLVFLATYVKSIIELTESIGPHLKPGALVMDGGSTKAKIVEAMNHLPDTVEAIGGHPMAGKATSGVDGIDARLYDDRVFALTPTERTTDAALEAAQSLVRLIGAEPVVLDAMYHDELVGFVSHLVRILPMAMLATARDQGDSILWKLAAGGFRELTEPAISEMSMWLDIYLTNSGGLPKAIRALSQQLEHIAGLVEQEDIDGLRALSEQAKSDWMDRYGEE